VKSRKYRTASFRNKLTSQCKHSHHTTNKAGNLQTTTEIEPGDNIIYQPDAITSWSDGSVLQWAQSFWSHVISVQPKSMSLLLLILVVKWRNKKKNIPQQEMALQLVLPNCEEHKSFKIQKWNLYKRFNNQEASL